MPISGFVIAVQIRRKPGACNAGEYGAKGQLKVNREPKTKSENLLFDNKNFKQEHHKRRKALTALTETNQRS